MKTEFKYLKHADLVFHVLAHMRVNNASDLYLQSYIDCIQGKKQVGDVTLSKEVATLEKYYNENFERLCMINFLPFYCIDLIELQHTLLNLDRFSKTDIEVFMKPFIDLLKRESVFYYDFWDCEYRVLDAKRDLYEKQIENSLNKYQCIFNYYRKSASIYFSVSLTRNGRGFSGMQNSFAAMVALPQNQEMVEHSIFQLLHEYTHQFTDDLLRVNINMTDGSHDLSENVAILADYYIIKMIDEPHLTKYLGWIASIYGMHEDEMGESDFLNAFAIPVNLDDCVKTTVNDILNNKEEHSQQ